MAEDDGDWRVGRAAQLHMQRQAVIGTHGYILAVGVAERNIRGWVRAQPDPADRDLLGHDHGTGATAYRASREPTHTSKPSPVGHHTPPPARRPPPLQPCRTPSPS